MQADRPWSPRTDGAGEIVAGTSPEPMGTDRFVLPANQRLAVIRPPPEPDAH
jgi:hypothetical protein